MRDDLERVKSLRDVPWDDIDLQWLEELDVLREFGFGAKDDAEPRYRDGWLKLCAELTFFAKIEDGWLALWRFDPGSTPDDAIVLGLDTEGQFEKLGATLPDALVAMADRNYNGEPATVAAFFEQAGIASARSAEEAFGRVKSAPNPNDRLARYQRKPPTLTGPTPIKIEDVLGMSEDDPRVQDLLRRLAGAGPPIECAADRIEGIISTVFLRRGHEPIRLRDLAVGSPAGDVAALGAPTRRGEGWERFDRDGLGLHVTIEGGVISKLTVMSLALMPPRLR